VRDGRPPLEPVDGDAAAESSPPASVLPSATTAAEGAREARADGRQARARLPTDAAATPPLDTDFHQTFLSALADIDLHLSAGQQAAIEAHARLLLAWTGAINLTALRSSTQVALLHVADSLTAVPLLRSLGRSDDAPAILDLGSGGGYPGLPLAIALPAARLALVDSIRKKAGFLEVAAAASVRALAESGEQPPAVEVHARRGEDLAVEPDHRERSDLVTARAVAEMRDLVEVALPLVRVGGLLVAWKRDDGRDTLYGEMDEAEPIIAAAGGAWPPDVEAISVRGIEDHRLVVVRKVRPTPPRYPRPVTERRRSLLP
jgi:16S rRNA (guanine527-N7)-methyltransferase